MLSNDVCITGLGLEIPALSETHALYKNQAHPNASNIFDAKKILGRKGLLSKDHATRLSLCAAKYALEDAGLCSDKESQQDPESLAVVVSSNLGNLDTICKVQDGINEGHVDDVSIMDAPNASSNIIASTIAIRFNCKATNIMLCSGAASGSQALYYAANMIRANRATRVIVVGVEVNNPITQTLFDDTQKQHQSHTRTLFDGAAAVILEAGHHARDRGAPIIAKIQAYKHARNLLDSLPIGCMNDYRPELWFAPRHFKQENVFDSQPVILKPMTINLYDCCGEAYGALGVLQVVAGCQWLKTQSSSHSFLATSGGTFDADSHTLLVRNTCN